jgi:hypothetical protein
VLDDLLDERQLRIDHGMDLPYQSQEAIQLFDCWVSSWNIILWFPIESIILLIILNNKRRSCDNHIPIDRQHLHLVGDQLRPHQP